MNTVFLLVCISGFILLSVQAYAPVSVNRIISGSAQLNMGKSFDDENRLRKAKGLPLLKKEEKKEETKKTGKGTGGFASLFGGVKKTAAAKKTSDKKNEPPTPPKKQWQGDGSEMYF